MNPNRFAGGAVLGHVSVLGRALDEDWRSVLPIEGWDKIEATMDAMQPFGEACVVTGLDFRPRVAVRATLGKGLLIHEGAIVGHYRTVPFLVDDDRPLKLSVAHPRGSLMVSSSFEPVRGVDLRIFGWRLTAATHESARKIASVGGLLAGDAFEAWVRELAEPAL